MNIIEENDKIKLSFVGKIDNGQIFKEIKPDSPLEVTIGNSELPPTVEKELLGMKEGEAKSIRVPPEEGYGPRLKELVHEIKISSFGDKIVPLPGMVLSRKIEKDGQMIEVPVTIVEVNDDTVTVDYNHPAAGHHLTYDISIQQITKNP